MFLIQNCDNISFANNELSAFPQADLIFADYIYESSDFSWILPYWNHLKNGGIFIAMTDWHTVFEIGVYLKSLENSNMINHLVWKNEWGNHPKDRFHQCFDDILIFSKGKEHNFYSDRIQVPKVTKTKGLNPSGRETKTATAWIEDICLTTTSLERVKQKDGHLIRWQKPKLLLQRLFIPFLNEGDFIIDPFMGSGTSAIVSMDNNYNYLGLELDKEVYETAKERIENYKKE